ncbi:MAG: hypothetical protein IAE80_27045 [Anaerolinea sp.]|nr:hypothetical protein [Anaerolinea sp.]
MSKQDDAQLLDFIRQKLNSFVKWDLVRFFHDNPFAADTAENIARYTGREPYLVQTDLGALASDGIVQVNEIAERKVYRLGKDPETRDAIRRFVLACDDRDFRVRAIQQVIEGLR